MYREYSTAGSFLLTRTELLHSCVQNLNTGQEMMVDMQVSLQLSFWMGRAGLLPLGVTSGHSQAHLMCSTRKHDARSKKR